MKFKYCIIIVLLTGVMSGFAQFPYLLYGRVYNSDGTIPADGDIRITTYNKTRGIEIDTSYNGGKEHAFWASNLSGYGFFVFYCRGDTVIIRMQNVNPSSPYYSERNEVEYVCPSSAEDWPATVEIGTSVVSVDLLTFSAEAERNDVTVSWTTGQSQCPRFIVERKKGDALFEEAGQVTGQTDKESGIYEFQDRNLDTGSYYYRLRFIHADGSSTCSYEVNVLVNIPKEFRLCQNYPNPFNASTCIEYELPKASEVHFQIFNTLGQRVYDIKKDHQKPGYFEFIWHGSASDYRTLPSGTYIIQMRADRYRSVKKIVLLK